MKINLLLVAGLCISLFACNNSEKAPEEIVDTYYGMLPCADCPGIYYELEFNPDFTYSEKRFYLESDVDTMIEHGTYRIKDDSLIIFKTPAGENGLYRLKISNGNLKILNGEGKENTSPLKDYFILKTTKPVAINQPENPMAHQKFNATGTEPFWTLEIDPVKNTINFKEPEGTDITVPLSKPQGTEGKLVYRPEATPNRLVIILNEEPCQNGMSGEMFTHKVSVTFKTPEMNQTKTYTGCGEYSVVRKEANNITGKWILEELNGKNIADNEEFKPATLEIDLDENRAKGNAGCNQFSGNAKLMEANQIGFSQVISTKMACPSLKMETEFLKALSDQSLTYSVTDEKLTLANSDNSLIFKKVD